MSLQKKIEDLARQHVDKVVHFIAGYLFFVFASLFVGAWLALGFVAIVATIKEIYDKKRNKLLAYEWLDFAFTLSGALPAFLITL